MRIGISTSVIQRGQTGIAQYVFAIVREFRHYTDQYEFTLFVLEDDLPLFDFVSDEMKIVPIPERFRSPAKNILWHQNGLPGFARQLRLDVLHVPSYRRMMWQQPCALVATIHDLAPFHVSKKYDWKRMFYGRVIAKRLAQRQHEIIAISRNTASDIVRFFGVPGQRISVIHNGVDHERFRPGSKETAQRVIANQHGIDAPYFLYLARLEHPAKNHVRLIEAFNQFKKETGSPWHLVFGGSDWHGAEEIHQQIRNSPFRGHIHSLGFIPDDDLPTLYRAAECFVYPSLFEGFGLPPVEAMACGCPVISSARGSLAEVLGDAAIVVDPENIIQMKQELARVAGDAALREHLNRTGLAHAQRFNWHDAAARTLEVYHRAAGKEPTVLAAPAPLVASSKLSG